MGFEMSGFRGAQNDELLFCTATRCPRVTWRLPYFEFAAFGGFHFLEHGVEVQLFAPVRRRLFTICTVDSR